jgi:hypothetical protein
MKIAVVAINLLVLFLIANIFRKADSSPLRKYFWWALSAKLIAGIALGLVYKYYYAVGDTFSYFHDAVLLSEAARGDFMGYLKFLWSDAPGFLLADQLFFDQPRALFLSKIASIICLVTADNYWVTTLYFSFLGFFAAWFLARAISQTLPGSSLSALAAFLFFPSVVFWSSGLIKESVAIAALFFLSGVFFLFWMHRKLSIIHWLLVPVAIWFLWSLKYYYLGVFLPVVSACIFMRYIFKPVFGQMPVWKTLALWFVVFLIPLFAISFLHPNFYPERFFEVIVSNYHAYDQLSSPDDMVHYYGMDSGRWTILANSPWALFSGLFRPFLWEAGNLFQLVASVENLVLFLLAATSLSGLKRFSASPHIMLTLAVSMYIVLLCVFLALSTPNFGTLARYRVGFLPYFIFLVTYQNPIVEKISSFKERRLVP